MIAVYAWSSVVAVLTATIYIIYRGVFPPTGRQMMYDIFAQLVAIVFPPVALAFLWRMFKGKRALTAKEAR